VVHQRTTPDFDAGTVPAGLLRAHRVAPEVWGEIEVLAGTLTFVWEDRPDAPVLLEPGDTLVIPPDRPHHVQPGPDARFHVSFHR
jgi:tellurite resistance-related uncharacterized protein